MKSTKKVTQEVTEKGIADGGNEVKTIKKRVVKPTATSNQPAAATVQEISKITLTEKDPNTYDVNVFFGGDRRPKNACQIDVRDVDDFFSNLYTSISKQVPPLSRSKPPKPPRVIEMSFQ